MDGLLSFLIFAGLFYFMMRVGCGSHMTHGHHGHKNNNQSQNIIDPVCGKIIAEDEGYGKLHNGLLYRFCSKNCLDDFDLNPEKYIDVTDDSQNGERHHGA